MASVEDDPAPEPTPNVEPVVLANASGDATGAKALEVEIDSDVRLHVACQDFVKQKPGAVEQWLSKMSPVTLQKVFKQKSWGYAFVTVQFCDRDRFKEAMSELRYKHSLVFVNEGTPRTDANKRSFPEDEAALENKKPKVGKSLTEAHVPTLKDLKDREKSRKKAHAKEESLQQKSAPLYEYAYATQLSMKGTYIKSAVRSFTKKVRTKCEDEDRDYPEWTSPEWSIGVGAPLGCPCPLDETIGTPATGLEGYRNKCEFTIGLNEAKEVEVGLVARSLADSSLQVASCQDVPHVPSPMKHLCQTVRDVVRASPFPVYERRRGAKDGTWRLVMARLSVAGEMLVLVQTTTLNDQDREALLKPLIGALCPAEPSAEMAHRVVSVYLQYNDDVTDAARSDAPLMHVHGKPRLVMPLLDCKFEIGPLSFFQANNVTCELLYTRAHEWLCPKDTAVVLDVCCGVGTIGLCMAKRCKQVIGLELVPEAVESARQNAELNDLKNASFHVGRAEDVLPGVLAGLGPDVDEVCAIVDPPRAGLHPQVLAALRGCKRLRRIVYISCNPDSLVEDVVKLTFPNETDEDPLVPTRAVAVDMFPHTLHCEMILCLDRSSCVADPRGKPSTEEQELSNPSVAP